jgi:hypothetical protein
MGKCLLALRTPEGIFRKRRQPIRVRVWTRGLLLQAFGNEFVQAIHPIS